VARSTSEVMVAKPSSAIVTNPPDAAIAQMGGLRTNPYAARTTSTAFRPPNAKELETAARTGISRALLGT